VPAIIVSPWIAEGEVFNDEYRHTSLIATLREAWSLGDAFTARDAAARTFSNVFTLDSPRDPKTWPTANPRPVPQFVHDTAGLGQALSTIGAELLDGIRGYAAQHNLDIEGLPKDPQAEVPADQVVGILRSFVGSFFPRLTATAAVPDHSPNT
jgi:phospholipase C